MFNKSTLRNKILFFISAYVPLYLIICIQNICNLLSKYKNGAKPLVNLFYNSYIYISFIFLIIIISSFVVLTLMINNLEKYSSNAFSIKVVKIKNINVQYTSAYLITYIFLFFIVKSSNISGIIEFILVFILIGYIYIKNEIIYVNPITSMFFNYNMYLIEFIYEDEDIGQIIKRNKIVYTKDNKYKLENRYINVIKENDMIYFNI